MFNGGHKLRLIKSCVLVFASLLLAFTPLRGGGITEAISDFSRTRVNFDVDPVISITTDTDVGYLEDPNNPGQPISPTQEGTIATFKEAVTVSTNNLTGYKLQMSMGTDSPNNSLNHTTSTTIPLPMIASTASAKSLTDLLPNTWGYNVPTLPSHGTNYQPLPDPNSQDPEQKQHTIKPDGQQGTETTQINFATKIDMSQPSGTYQNTVLFTATTNEPPALQPKAILGDNGNLNFVYDANTYKVDDYYDDNKGHTQIKAVYDVPYNATISTEVPWAGRVDSADYRSDITSVNFTDDFYYYQPASTRTWFFQDRSISSITNLNNLNTSNVYNMDSMFNYTGYNVDSFSLQGLDEWDTHNVTNMHHLFQYAGRAAKTWSIGDFSDWQTSKVTKMSGMFASAGMNAATWSVGNLDKWDTSKVTDMNNMFASAGMNAATWFVGDLSNWDVGQVTDMSSMFNSAGKENAVTWSVGNLDDWNTEQVTNMSGMFAGAGMSATTWSVGNLDKWDTSKVTDMNNMFASAGMNAATWSVGDLGNWRTDNVTNTQGMFVGAGMSATTWSVGDLGSWNTGKVVDMGAMFNNAGNQASIWSVGNLDNWNTSNVENMNTIFAGAGGHSKTWSVGNLKDWDVSKVIDMNNMFAGAGQNSDAAISLDLSNWHTNSLQNAYHMFISATHLQTIYVGDGWNIPADANGEGMFIECFMLTGGAGTTWSSSHVDKDYAHVDGGPSNPGYFTYKGSNPPTPVNPGGGGENVVNNVTNVLNNISNNNNNDNNTNTTDSKDGYVAPQGVVNTSTNSSPNWFLIICLAILSLGLLALIIFLIWKLRKQKKTATSA